MSEINIIAPDDWRRQNQISYLKGVVLIFKKYHPYHLDWDHDHCEFCGDKFSLNKGNLKEGYTTKKQYHWICDKCFRDFETEFKWKVN